MKKKLLLLPLLAAVFFSNAQNVGINTTTPQATLDIRGSQRTGGINNYVKYDSATGRIEWVGASLFTATSQQIIKHSASSEGLYAGSGKLDYRNSTGTPVFFSDWTNGNGYFAGDVGIGTVTPQHKLHLFTGVSGATAPFGYNMLALEASNNINMSFLTPDAYGTAIWFSKPSQPLSGGIFYNNGTTDGFLFRTNNAPRMVITNAGKIGINTNSPLAKLHVIDGNGSGGTPFTFSRLAVEGDGHTYINLLSPDANETAILFGKASNAASGVIMYNNSSNPDGFQFRNNGNLTRMVINNAGNVGIGTTSPAAKLHISAGDASFALFGPNSYNAMLYVGASPNNQSAALTAQMIASDGNLHIDPAAGKNLYFGYFQARDIYLNPNGGNVGIGTNNPSTRLHIQNGSSGNSSPYSPLTVETNTNTYINLLSPNANETSILFGKTDNAASGGIIYNNQGPAGTLNGFQFRVNGNQEAVRIDNAGNMGVGAGTSTGDRLTIGQKITNPYALTIYEINGAGNGASYWRIGIDVATKRLYFLSNTAGAAIAFIDPSNGNWVAISDKTLKKDIHPLGPVMTKLMQLKPVSYKMVYQHNDERSYGFLAQELQQVLPDAVKQFGNQGDQKLGISYTHLIPVAIAAIQEQQQTIKGLQQQVDELRKMVEKILKQ